MPREFHKQSSGHYGTVFAVPERVRSAENVAVATYCLKFLQSLNDNLSSAGEDLRCKIVILTPALQVYSKQPEIVHHSSQGAFMGKSLCFILANIVLSTKFHELSWTVAPVSVFLQNLEEAVDKLERIGCHHYLSIVQWLIENHWRHPTLACILKGEADEDEALNYILTAEIPEILFLRLRILVENGMEEMALNLGTVCLHHPELKLCPDVWAHNLLLSLRAGDMQKFHDQCHLLDPCISANLLETFRVQLACSCLSCSDEELFQIASTLLTENLQQPHSDACCTQRLAAAWLNVCRLFPSNFDCLKDQMMLVVRLSKKCALVEQVFGYKPKTVANDKEMSEGKSASQMEEGSSSGSQTANPMVNRTSRTSEISSLRALGPSQIKRSIEQISNFPSNRFSTKVAGTNTVRHKPNVRRFNGDKNLNEIQVEEIDDIRKSQDACDDVVFVVQPENVGAGTGDHGNSLQLDNKAPLLESAVSVMDDPIVIESPLFGEDSFDLLDKSGNEYGGLPLLTEVIDLERLEIESPKPTAEICSVEIDCIEEQNECKVIVDKVPDFSYTESRSSGQLAEDENLPDSLMEALDETAEMIRKCGEAVKDMDQEKESTNQERTNSAVANNTSGLNCVGNDKSGNPLNETKCTVAPSMQKNEVELVAPSVNKVYTKPESAGQNGTQQSTTIIHVGSVVAQQPPRLVKGGDVFEKGKSSLARDQETVRKKYPIGDQGSSRRVENKNLSLGDMEFVPQHDLDINDLFEDFIGETNLPSPDADESKNCPPLNSSVSDESEWITQSDGPSSQSETVGQPKSKQLLPQTVNGQKIVSDMIQMLKKNQSPNRGGEKTGHRKMNQNWVINDLKKLIDKDLTDEGENKDGVMVFTKDSLNEAPPSVRKVLSQLPKANQLSMKKLTVLPRLSKLAEQVRNSVDTSNVGIVNLPKSSLKESEDSCITQDGRSKVCKTQSADSYVSNIKSINPVKYQEDGHCPYTLETAVGVDTRSPRNLKLNVSGVQQETASNSDGDVSEQGDTDRYPQNSLPPGTAHSGLENPRQEHGSQIRGRQSDVGALNAGRDAGHTGSACSELKEKVSVLNSTNRDCDLLCNQGNQNILEKGNSDDSIKNRDIHQESLPGTVQDSVVSEGSNKDLSNCINDTVKQKHLSHNLVSSVSACKTKTVTPNCESAIDKQGEELGFKVVQYPTNARPVPQSPSCSKTGSNNVDVIKSNAKGKDTPDLSLLCKEELNLDDSRSNLDNFVSDLGQQVEGKKSDLEPNTSRDEEIHLFCDPWDNSDWKWEQSLESEQEGIKPEQEGLKAESDLPVTPARPSRYKSMYSPKGKGRETEGCSSETPKQHYYSWLVSQEFSGEEIDHELLVEGKNIEGYGVSPKNLPVEECSRMSTRASLSSDTSRPSLQETCTSETNSRIETRSGGCSGVFPKKIDVRSIKSPQGSKTLGTTEANRPSVLADTRVDKGTIVSEGVCTRKRKRSWQQGDCASGPSNVSPKDGKRLQIQRQTKFSPGCGINVAQSGKSCRLSKTHGEELNTVAKTLPDKARVIGRGVQNTVEQNKTVVKCTNRAGAAQSGPFLWKMVNNNVQPKGQERPASKNVLQFRTGNMEIPGCVKLCRRQGQTVNSPRNSSPIITHMNPMAFRAAVKDTGLGGQLHKSRLPADNGCQDRKTVVKTDCVEKIHKSPVLKGTGEECGRYGLKQSKINPESTLDCSGSNNSVEGVTFVRDNLTVVSDNVLKSCPSPTVSKTRSTSRSPKQTADPSPGKSSGKNIDDVTMVTGLVNLMQNAEIPCEISKATITTIDVLPVSKETASQVNQIKSATPLRTSPRKVSRNRKRCGGICTDCTYCDQWSPNALKTRDRIFETNTPKTTSGGCKRQCKTTKQSPDKELPKANCDPCPWKKTNVGSPFAKHEFSVKGKICPPHHETSHPQLKRKSVDASSDIIESCPLSNKQGLASVNSVSPSSSTFIRRSLRSPKYTRPEGEPVMSRSTSKSRSKPTLLRSGKKVIIRK